MYMHDRPVRALPDRGRARQPTAFAAATATAVAAPLVRQTDALTARPARCPSPRLFARRLADTDARGDRAARPHLSPPYAVRARPPGGWTTPCTSSAPPRPSQRWLPGAACAPGDGALLLADRGAATRRTRAGGRARGPRRGGRLDGGSRADSSSASAPVQMEWITPEACCVGAGRPRCRATAPAGCRSARV